MDLWFTEKIEDKTGLAFKVKSTLHHETSPYQSIDVLDTESFGKMLLLDGAVMLTERDEFIYHEMIVHVPLQTHPRPESLLVIGGGDGGTVREILKHASAGRIDLVEIDLRVVEVCKAFFPRVSSGLADPRVHLQVEDGIAWVSKAKARYDVVLVDSTDPVGPAKGLIEKSFFQDVHASLKEDGIMVAQSESPFFHAPTIQKIYRTLREVFPIVKMYLAHIPTYPSGLWSFAFCSKRYDPLLHLRAGADLSTRYYNEGVHRSAFSLPGFIQACLQ